MTELIATPEATTKQMIWERKLLDFSLRNNLLNAKVGRKVILFSSSEIDLLEDRLQAGEDYNVTPQPGTSEQELQTSLKYIYRAARTSLEENGANSLFLTIGMLEWYETAKSEQPRLAPILLLPVDIVRRSGNHYIIRKRDEDIILNITLVELLKQGFDINLDGLKDLPKDESGVDVKLIFDQVRKAIAEQDRWRVVEESMLGLFSFNKFVMWNDIHTNADKLRANVVVASLIDKQDKQEVVKDAVDARRIDKENAPMDFAIPLDVDSSQMEAIVESGRGRSFILHGPPGTGKSQTITNMIANALYQGKRVLFVAEKMAALSVVQSRLAKINLAPFCLELHSNKATKKHFLEQMDEVLKVTKIKSPEEYAQRSAELFNERKELISYMEALHQKSSNGLSLYDCISEHLSIQDGDDETPSSATFQLPPKEQLTADFIARCREQVEPINAILEIVGQPNQHALFGLEPIDNRQETLDTIRTLLQEFKKQHEKFESQADKWFLVRWIAKLKYAMASKRITKQTNALTIQAKTADDIVAHAEQWLAGYHTVRDWYHWVDQKRELTKMGAGAVVAKLEEGAKPDVAMNGFLKAIFRFLIESAIDANEQLRMFNGLKFRQKIEKYKRDTARFQELSKEELYSKLASRVPSTSAAIAEGSEISILKRNIANGGRGNSIRSIIDNTPTLLPRLCPCMLMSPISVAQYIDLNAEKFDLVIFDEASQMPTSEAVGAIARGKALIVVGDSKQMPPTSFFSSNQVDEEEADIDDMESILDDCITLSLCEHQLNWHYRSKHESLIAFSNSQYYGNNLLTFPSVDDHVAKVTLVPVNGVYDKGRTRSNQEESTAIVNEILRRLADEELQKYSIGVVAFSKVQGDLIEDDLLEALDKNPQLKEIAMNGKEPIFVKNLENVQGDERDVILFSIGYGADKDGKVSMNFGPLNNAGGERRLNVAVSRARYEMMVFSTLKASQIDLKRSNAKGVEGLKFFLEYAETGKLPTIPGATQSQTSNVMVKQICDALEREGYVTESFVGRSNFKVDIAVATREHPETFVLGILCDGKTYFQTKTTRDREIVQPNALRNLNWRVMRVYSIDWYENRDRTLDQILQELKSAESGMTHEEPAEEKADYVFDADKIKESGITVDEARNKAMKSYKECGIEATNFDKDKFDPYDRKILTIIKKILKDEQPITEGYLCKRLAKVLGFGHAGANIQRAVSAAAGSLYQDPLSIDGVYSYWLDEQSADGYKSYRSPSPRTITEIPAVEIANAILEVVEEEFSLPKDKIPTIAARKLGFSSAGAKICEVINKVIDLLERNASIGVSNDKVTIQN